MDPASLRLLAHPLRSRIMAELRTQHTATASDLARTLGTHTGATSYHLRRLAEGGLVRDTGAGAGRRRLWEVSPEAAPPTPGALDSDADDDAEAALEWLARDYVQHFASKGQDWITASGQWPATWQDACGLDDRQVLVTDEQLTRLRSELAEVLGRYRRIGAGNPRAKRVAFYTCALPVDQGTP